MPIGVIRDGDGVTTGDACSRELIEDGMDGTDNEP
jgi:hypothetical protein